MAETHDTPQLLTTEEAATIAQVKARRVRKWVESGRLPARQRRPKILVDREDLDRFLRNRKPPVQMVFPEYEPLTDDAGEASQLLTTQEAAAIAEVSARTVQKWVASGDLRPAQRQPRTFISRADLDRFLRRRHLIASVVSPRKETAEPEQTTFTISDAARVCGVDRTTLQRAIRAGRLQLDVEHRLKKSDLIRTGYLRSDPLRIGRPVQEATSSVQGQFPKEGSSYPPDEPIRTRLDRLDAQVTTLLAQQQTLSERMDQIQHSLDALNTRKSSTGESRQKILAFMKRNPGPHHVREIQQGLRWKHTPRYTLRHLTNAGLLRRTHPGIYELPSESR